MNYVKINLEEYDSLKEAYNSIKEGKVLSISYAGMFAWSTPVQEYYTESEVITKLTERINELECANNELRDKLLHKPTIEVKKKKFLGIF